jgi:tryptophanase
MRYPAEPFRIKVVEPIRYVPREERGRLLEEAGLNIFAVPADSIYIDLLTDSGTSAMSDRQWAGLMIGDESYAGSRNFYSLQKTVRAITGFEHVIPTHQGRSAEHLLFSALVSKGQIVPNNSHFDTTRANVEAQGAEALDLVIDAALDPAAEHPFKGNMDLAKLDRVLSEHGPRKIPLVMITITNNSGGGQPVSLENAREVRAICDRHGVPLYFDACRFAENSFFIKDREPAHRDRSVREIARSLFDCAEGCTMSAKKDGLVNIGGFLAFRHPELREKVTNLLLRVEGFPTYGGLAGRDLEGMARGLEEVLDEDYLSFRIGQVRGLGRMLMDADVPIVRPVGGHAVYIDSRKFAPHIPHDQFPGQALVAALYRDYGIRAVEVGALMFGHPDPATGEPVLPRLDLVRLAIPRRVYTSEQMRYVGQSVIEIYRGRERLRGLRITYEAPVLRHFTARLAPIEPVPAR